MMVTTTKSRKIRWRDIRATYHSEALFPGSQHSSKTIIEPEAAENRTQRDSLLLLLLLDEEEGVDEAEQMTPSRDSEETDEGEILEEESSRQVSHCHCNVP